MNWLHRLAWRAHFFTAAQSSHEELLYWFLRLLWLPPWAVKRQYPLGAYLLDMAIVLNKSRGTGGAGN